MTQAHLLIAIEDGIARLTFNRPEVRNALSPEIVENIMSFFVRAEFDRSIRCIVLSGAGRNFMAGGDVNSFIPIAQQAPPQRRQTFETRLTKGNEVFSVMQRLPQPIVCSVTGGVAGAGMGFLTACDLVVATENATFTMAYVNIGLSLDAGTSYHLPRAIGLKRAKTMALMGRPIDAQTALRYGLLDWVVADDALEFETDKIARTLASGASVAMAQIKSQLNQSFNSALAGQLAAEAVGMGVSASSEDFVEGTNAFLEKRKTRFKGR